MANPGTANPLVAVTMLKVGLFPVPTACPILKVTAPVDALTPTPVPATALVTPVLVKVTAPVAPLTEIPVPAAALVTALVMQLAHPTVPVPVIVPPVSGLVNVMLVTPDPHPVQLGTVIGCTNVVPVELNVTSVVGLYPPPQLLEYFMMTAAPVPATQSQQLALLLPCRRRLAAENALAVACSAASLADVTANDPFPPALLTSVDERVTAPVRVLNVVTPVLVTITAPVAGLVEIPVPPVTLVTPPPQPVQLGTVIACANVVPDGVNVISVVGENVPPQLFT